jgi:hypothetical protein
MAYLFQAFVDSVDAKEHITEVLDKEQASRAGDGFCAAVSLKDGRTVDVFYNVLIMDFYFNIMTNTF